MHPCHFVFISLIADPIEVHTAKATMSSCTAFLVRLAAVAVCCGANAADVQVVSWPKVDLSPSRLFCSSIGEPKGIYVHLLCKKKCKNWPKGKKKHSSVLPIFESGILSKPICGMAFQCNPLLTMTSRYLQESELVRTRLDTCILGLMLMHTRLSSLRP